MEDKPKKKDTRKCWYFITVRTCVLCWKEETIRERRYDEKPENPDDRHEYQEYTCESHFF
jgi:hypothetical protein